MRFKFIFLFIIFNQLVSYHSFAQTTGDQKKIDSVLTILNEKKQDTNTINHYHILSWEYQYTDDKKALRYAEKGFALSEKLKWKRGIQKMAHNKANIHYLRDEYKDAVKFNKISIKTAKELKLNHALGGAYNNLGMNYDALSKFSDALDSYFNALKYYRLSDNEEGETKTLGNIGNIYISLSDFDKATEYHKKSMKQAIRRKDTSSIINAFVNLGLVDERLKKLDSAIHKYLFAMSLCEKTNYKRGYYSICNNLGAAYSQTGDLELAEKYILIPYEYYKENHLDYQLALAAGNLGITAMENKNYPKAEKYLLETKKFAHQSKATEVEKDAVYFLYALYKEWKKYDMALLEHEEYKRLLDTLNNLEEQKKIAEQEAEMKVQNKQIADSLHQIQIEKEAQLKHDRELEEQKWFTYAGVGIACIAFVFLGLVYRNFRQKKRANQLLEEKNSLIQKQKKEVEVQKLIVEEKQKEITDSINYAKRIQYSLLAHDDLLRQNLGEHFVLFKPKDIVSGDFYWATVKQSGNQNESGEKSFYLAVSDCTGHGVPGAFMSLLNISFLNEAINEKNISEPHEVLNFVRERLIQNMEGGQDGMDAILVRFKVQGTTFKVEYAAAHNRPVLISNGELHELSADKMPVGKGERTDSFTLHTIEVKKGDTLYLYTDGYADQFGGEKGKKFKYSNLNKLLMEISTKELNLQSEILNVEFNNWKADLEQVDDVCVIGIRI